MVPLPAHTHTVSSMVCRPLSKGENVWNIPTPPHSSIALFPHGIWLSGIYLESTARPNSEPSQSSSESGDDEIQLCFLVYAYTDMYTAVLSG